jgi:alpha-N-arabinofuranosidase
MTGMERNSDLVQRSCYAPLFVNVNPAANGHPRAWQWDSDLIGYDALTSYGSPSYYTQKIFNTYIGNKVVPIVAENAPMRTPAMQDTVGLSRRPNARQPKAQRPVLFYVATQDTKAGIIYLKVVNTIGTPQPVIININSSASVAAVGKLVVLKAEKPDDTNTITDPEKIIPAVSTINGLGKTFTRTFDPYSVTVIELHTVKAK